MPIGGIWGGFGHGAPGLTIYGGVSYEGRPDPNAIGLNYPTDWRYIGFNNWVDHTNSLPTTTTNNRFHHFFDDMGSSRIEFAPGPGYDRGLNIANPNTGLVGLEATIGGTPRSWQEQTATLDVTANQVSFRTGRNPASTSDIHPEYYDLFYAYRPLGTTSDDLGKFVCHGRMYVGIDG